MRSMIYSRKVQTSDYTVYSAGHQCETSLGGQHQQKRQQHGRINSCEHIVHHYAEPAGQVLQPVDRVWLEDVKYSEKREARNRPPAPARAEPDHIRRDEDERNDLPTDLVHHNLTRVFSIEDLFGAVAGPES